MYGGTGPNGGNAYALAGTKCTPECDDYCGFAFKGAGCAFVDENCALNGNGVERIFVD